MYIHKRKDRQGNTYYSFSYVDDEGRRIRLKKSEHPHFDLREEASTWAKSQDAYRSARKARLERKLAWRKKYYQFNDLLQGYQKWQKEKAPNSFENSVYMLEQYVFVFFLNVKQASNVNDWHLLFREFLDWLRDGAPGTKRKSGKLAVATSNNIIRCLNTFLTYLKDYNLIDPDNVVKCKAYPEHMLSRRGLKDVITEEEMNMVRKRLLAINEPASDFFYTLWHTGMRFSELFGLPITSLIKGQVPHRALHDELLKCGIEYHGYIYLESQPKHDDRRREKDGTLARKPLKGNREISPKYARIIPIRSKEIWNILATRYKAQSKAFLKKQYTDNKSDYVFFEDLEWNKAVNSLRETYKQLGLTPKQYHCCRHSFATLLVGETRSFFLVRSITGHRKDRSFERYLHVFEQMAMAAKQMEQEIDVI